MNTLEDLIFKHFNGCQWYAPILDTRIKEFATEYAASLNRQGWTRVETRYDIDFIVWYSGMSEDKIKAAYERYKTEIEQGQP